MLLSPGSALDYLKFPFGKERRKKMQHLLKQKAMLCLTKIPIVSKQELETMERDHSTDHIRAWQSSTVETSVQIGWMWENSSLWERLGLWGTRTECSTWDTSATAARDACYNADPQAQMQHGCIHATAPSELMQKLDWERFLSSPTQLKATKYIRFILLFLQQAGVSLHLPLPLETAEVNFGLEAQALRNPASSSVILLPPCGLPVPGAFWRMW